MAFLTMSRVLRLVIAIVIWFYILYVIIEKHVLSTGKLDTGRSASREVITASQTQCHELHYNTSLWVSGRWPRLDLADNSAITFTGAYYQERSKDNATVRVLGFIQGRQSVFVNKTLLYRLIPSLDFAPVTETAKVPSRLLLSGMSEITFTCGELPSLTAGRDMPCYIELGLSGYETITRVPIVYPYREEEEKVIGICVPVLYGFLGDKEARSLVEWFETNLLFGVSEINMYNSSITCTNLVLRVLNYYQRIGVLKMTEFPPVLPTETDVYKANYLLKNPSLNDCMLRNVYRYSAVICLVCIHPVKSSVYCVA